MSSEALFTADYVNESHIHAFAEALAADADFQDRDASKPVDPSAPPSPVVSTTSSMRIRKVSALSDFAPVNLKVKKYACPILPFIRRRPICADGNEKDKSYPGPRKTARHDWTFVLFRWPLLACIFLFIAAQFGFYVFLRQLVNIKEWISAWRGKKGLLRKKLRASRTYEEWKEAALVLDEYLHFDEWKKEDEDPFYDWKLVRLYSETFLGTKDLIEAYFDEQEKALEFIRESQDLKIDEKKRFFKAANTNLGITALCLSGGASFGYYHVGVVKALLDEGLLPRVITGTSAGGLIANAELKLLLVPELANKITACEESFGIWIKRLWKTGARFDPILWARKCAFFTRGSMTFKEAYLRTGRILNISGGVGFSGSFARTHVIMLQSFLRIDTRNNHLCNIGRQTNSRIRPTRLLNYLTAPDTLIWSALLASAAVPGILPPVVLMQKLRDGTAVPWNWGSRFKDGSLRVDVPIQALHTYFNVCFPIVSQVNPHVHLFFFAPRGSAGKPVAHRKGKGWRGNFILSAAEQWLKHELTKNFKLIRDLELLPQLLGQDWSSVFLQRFDGNVTIWPRTRFWDWIRILSDPDSEELERMMRVGQLVTWPKLRIIANRAKIEKQIYLGRQSVRKSSKSKAAVPSADATHQRQGMRFPISATPPPSGSDRPLSVDTDAEQAFTHNDRSFFRHKRIRVSPSNSGTSTPREHRQADPLRSPATRRKWASSLLNTANDNVSPSSSISTPGSEGFFMRLRTKSLSTLSGGTTVKEVPIDAAEDAWSSDTSSEDDLLVDEDRGNPSLLLADDS
ncbi:Patatin-like phospholipase domain-containing protein [Mycena sanguinolenta]|uniref:Patatin-like phospholipase domain-containing protein n=1 Tax=Mycena sanguinolenta TaxID=230812 RepID=A0A8H6Y8T6_9AGAR|nr:Patatin-like phospholipase domain-containing protein [Mycena sanguinolenta]